MRTSEYFSRNIFYNNKKDVFRFLDKTFFCSQIMVVFIFYDKCQRNSLANFILQLMNIFYKSINGVKFIYNRILMFDVQKLYCSNLCCNYG